MIRTLGLASLLLAAACAAEPTDGTGGDLDFDADPDLAVDPGPTCIAQEELSAERLIPGPAIVRDLAAVTDATGATHLAYQTKVGSVETLRYVQITPEGTLLGDHEVHASVDDRGVGRDVSIALDGANRPHLAFVDTSVTGAPKFFHATRGDTWSFASPLLGAKPSIAITPDGAVHLASTGARYATNTGGSWMSTDILDAHRPSLAVAADGSVHAILATDEGILHAVRQANGFRFDVVDARVWDPEASGTQATFDARGRLHVVYRMGDEQRYARLENGTWTREKIRDTESSATSILALADGRIVTTSIEWVSPYGFVLMISGRTSTGSWVTRAKTCGFSCGDAALVQRGDAIGVVYGESTGVMLATFDAPDDRDNDCDGTAW